MNERLTAAEALAARLTEERAELERRETTLQLQATSIGDETVALAKQNEELLLQLEGLRGEKLRLEARQHPALGRVHLLQTGRDLGEYSARELLRWGADRHMTVCRFVDAEWRQARNHQTSALRQAARLEQIEGLSGHKRRQDAQHRDVHLLAGAADLALAHTFDGELLGAKMGDEMNGRTVKAYVLPEHKLVLALEPIQ
jgi:hypothetical protein